jgi:hypothetical protein
MSEPDAFEELDELDQMRDEPVGEEPILDPEAIALTSHWDADEADLIEQAIEVPEDPDEATGR